MQEEDLKIGDVLHYKPGTIFLTQRKFWFRLQDGTIAVPRKSAGLKVVILLTQGLSLRVVHKTTGQVRTAILINGHSSNDDIKFYAPSLGQTVLHCAASMHWFTHFKEADQ